MDSAMDMIQALAEAQHRAYLAALEEMLERSLTDPLGRGVLVSDDRTTIRLSEGVPWGCVMYESEHQTLS